MAHCQILPLYTSEATEPQDTGGATLHLDHLSLHSSDWEVVQRNQTSYSHSPRHKQSTAVIHDISPLFTAANNYMDPKK